MLKLIYINFYFIFLVPAEKSAKHGKKGEKEDSDKDYDPEKEESGSESEEETSSTQETSSIDEAASDDEEEVSTPAKSMRVSLEETKRDAKNKKRKKQPSDHENSKRKKNDESEVKTDEIEEKKDGNKNKKEKTAKKIKKTDSKDDKEEKIVSKYNDKNVNYNLFNEAPENIIQTSIKIASNVMMMSKNVEAPGETKGLTYEYAALSFVRRQKNGLPFEFHLPLALAPTIIEGIKLIMKDNSKFFAKKPDVKE